MNLRSLIDTMVSFLEALKGADYLAKVSKLIKTLAETPPLLILAYFLIGLSLILIPLFDFTGSISSTAAAIALPKVTIFWIKAGAFWVASLFNPLLIPLAILESLELRSQYFNDWLSRLIKDYHSFLSGGILVGYLFALDWSESQAFISILVLQLFASIVADLVHRSAKQDTSV